MNASKKPLNKHFHTARSQKGMGDYYGSAIRAKMGTIRDSTVGINPLPPLKLKKPPKSLA